jgi:hypothetical protein
VLATARNKSWSRLRRTNQAGCSQQWAFTGTLLDQKDQSRPIQLMEAANVRIILYVIIRSAVNPYDPKWELYLESRLG